MHAPLILLCLASIVGLFWWSVYLTGLLWAVLAAITVGVPLCLNLDRLRALGRARRRFPAPDYAGR